MSALTSLVSSLGITIKSTAISGKREGWDASASHWKVTLRFQGRQITTAYSMGSGHKGEPKADDVLSSLLLDCRSGEYSSFEDFASEFGYDLDSRKAEAVYLACKTMTPKVRRFCGESFDAIEAAASEH